MPESNTLTTEECERLLRSGVVGRIAVSALDGPHIIPINFSVVDDSIIVRTSPDSLLATQGPGRWVAFEVDQFDHEYHRGWSVQARGQCDVVEDVDALARIEVACPPRPWADGERPVVLRLAWSELTGRRLGKHWDRRDEPLVRRTR